MKFTALILFIFIPLMVTSTSTQISLHKYSEVKTESKPSMKINEIEMVSKEFQNTFINSNSETQFSKNLIPLYLFSGICLIVFILTTAFIVYFKQAQFFYYALYILLIFLYLSLIPFSIDNYLFGGNDLISLWFLQTIKVVFNIVYVLFCLYFIDVKKNYNSIYRLLIAIIYIELIFIVINSHVLLNEYYTINNYLMHAHHWLFVIIPATFCILYVAVFSKNNLTYFVVIGASFYFLSFLAQYYIEFDNPTIKIFKEHNYFLMIGFTLEIIIFTFGLSYKILTDYKDKIRFQQKAFINETRALRAQINPHFIFNSLSSIQNFITSNNKVLALKYLSKFSRFSRNILESSIETNVVLGEEIKMLEDYLELETLRFDDIFTYHISIDDSIN